MTPLKARSKLETQLARAERDIAKIDARKVEIEALYLDPAVYSDVPQLQALHREMETLAAQSEAAHAEWERVAASLLSS